jgi:ornithine cyclodeaminase/alanine dehydrogenase-like protein (mu-crystallin family)
MTAMDGASTGRPTTFGPTMLLSRAEIESRLDMTDALTVVPEVLRELALGRVIMPAKVTMDLSPFGMNAWNTAMPAFIESLGASGFKWVGGFLDNPANHGLPFLIATILVQDSATGYPLAIMDGVYITNLRTGAVVATAIRLYGRPDARSVAFIGSGAAALVSMDAVLGTSEISDIRVHDVDANAADRFARRVEASHQANATIHDDAESAVRDADIVITATQSTTPLVRRDWLADGVTAISLGSQGQEFDDQIVLGADKLVCDSWEQCAHLGELRTFAEAGRLSRADVHAEIGDTLAGLRTGRENETELILVVPIGLAALDVALARLVFDRARTDSTVRTFRFFDSGQVNDRR